MKHDNSKKLLIDDFPREVIQAEMFEEKVSDTRSSVLSSSCLFRSTFLISEAVVRRCSVKKVFLEISQN